MYGNLDFFTMWYPCIKDYKPFQRDRTVPATVRYRTEALMEAFTEMARKSPSDLQIGWGQRQTVRKMQGYNVVSRSASKTASEPLGNRCKHERRNRAKRDVMNPTLTSCRA